MPMLRVMSVFQVSGMLAFLLASLVVSVRLLLLARRTRQLPEFTIGMALLLGGCLGNILIYCWRVAAPELGAAAAWVGGSSLVCLILGGISQAIFTWHVFYRGERWATALCSALSLMGVAGWIGQWMTIGFAVPGWEGLWFWLGFGARSLPFLWGSVASGVYAVRMTRRVRLGLAAPVVANRFWMWAIGAGCVFLIYGLSAAVELLGGAAFSVVPQTIRALLGLLTASCMWLAFIPPAFWKRLFDPEATVT